MADFSAPQNPGLAAFIQPYLSWREKLANESKLADLMLPKAIPDYLAGVAYGTNPHEPPLTSWRSTLAYGLPAVEALGIAPALRPVARGGLAAYGALERRMIPPAGQLNMFAGPGAKTADLAALARAQSLEAGGVAPQEIWNQTGWFKGPEGKWKFEIPDSGADIKVENLVGNRNTGGLTANFIDQLSDVMNHPGYFKAYPDETHNPVIGKLKIGKGLPEYGSLHTKLEYPAIGVTAPTVESAKGQVLHELQHLIQKNEGFARGGSPVNATQQAYDDYLRLGGEAEARAVQSRMNMTPQQRREVFPLESYDVPINELIFNKKTPQGQLNMMVGPNAGSESKFMNPQYFPEGDKGYLLSLLESLGIKTKKSSLERLSGLGIDVGNADTGIFNISGDPRGGWNLAQARSAGAEDFTPYYKPYGIDRNNYYYPPSPFETLRMKGIDPELYAERAVGRIAESTAESEILNQADPAVRAMITEQLKLQGLRDVQITDGVIRDEIARRNAATMLGLPEGNTAADRAAALGFDADTYHFTNGRFSAFDPNKISSHSGDEGFLGRGFYSTTDKNVGQGWGTQVSMPLKVPDKNRNRQIVYQSINPRDKEENFRLAMGYPKDWTPADITAELVRQGKSGISIDLSPRGYNQKEIMTISPTDIRSRFAAFDPARAKESDILAGLAGASLIPALTLQDYFRQGQPR